MSSYHWKLSLLKDGVRITLFATTDAAMVEQDLSGDSSRSLIHIARQYHRRPQTKLQDHRDLAIGALMTYAAAAPYNLEFEQMEAVASVPDCGLPTYVGGNRDTGLVPIWEATEELDEDDE